MEFRHSDALSRRELREEVGHGTSEQRLAGARWAVEEDVVAACHGDDEGAFGLRLATDGVEGVRWVDARRRGGVTARCGCERKFLFEMEEQAFEVAHRDDVDAIDEKGLLEVGLRDEDAGEVMLLGALDGVDDTPDRADTAVESQLTDEDAVVDLRLFELTADGEDGHGDGQVVVGAVFRQFGGGEVDGDFGAGELK